MNFFTKNELESELSEIQGKEKVEIKRTTETPEILLCKNEGKIKFEGRSLPENPKDFYAPIKSWLSVYAENPPQKTHVTFMFDYFNTSSSKVIMEIIDILKSIESRNGEVIIDWLYQEDDEDMLEAGEDFASITDASFNYFSYY